tara:strand:- start:1171 stop:3156 length:1986 start_codon:yes stop_codon:yes gene_type:complete
MINIKLQNNYKSIKSLANTTLPDLTILTGLNGSGKSQFLEAIANGSIQLTDEVGVQVSHQPNVGHIKKYDWNTLIPNNSGAIDPNTLYQQRNSQWYDIEKHLRNDRNKLLAQFRPLDLPDEIKKLRTLYNNDLPKTFESATNPEHAKLEQFKNMVIQRSENFINNYGQNNPQRKAFIEKLQSKLKCPIIFISKDQFDEHCAIYWDATDVFTHSFERLFTAYEQERIDNEINEWRRTEKKQNVTYLTSKEYREKYGAPPWDVVNDILKRVTPKYTINKPNCIKKEPFQAQLTNKRTGDTINFSDLSSGERILISFAFCLYYLSDDKQFLNRPKVLLFDEIDAPLHPSMTKVMLEVIKDVLVDKFNTRVILTTHSPSTVAIAPDESIFTIEGDTDKFVKKVTKDFALSLLTAGVPSLSIRHQNRRQVFVESTYDVSFYEKITAKLSDKINPEISLNFIPSGKNGNGSCDQVKEIVNKLSRGGTDTVRGIVDWDNKNNGNDFVKVLGKNQRYSIENYIFDPILLAMYLLREKYISKSDINLKSNENHTNLINFTNARLQKVADLVLVEIKMHIEPTVCSEKTTRCNYVGGKHTILPNWFLYEQGHKLECAIKATFPRLKQPQYNGEGKLKSAIQNKVIDDHYEFIPTDLLDLLRELQEEQICPQ